MFSTLMTLTSLSLSMLLSLCAYLLTANTFTRPEHAPLSAILIGAVSFFLFWFCGGILSDMYVSAFAFLRCLICEISTSADAFYMCYCIDQDQGTRTCEEVYNIVSLSFFSKKNYISNTCQHLLVSPAKSSHQQCWSLDIHCACEPIVWALFFALMWYFLKPYNKTFTCWYISCKFTFAFSRIRIS